MLGPRTGALTSAGIAMAALISVAPAHAEPGGYLDQDETFHRLLITPDDSGTVMVITNFALLRAQGLEACQVIENGYGGYAATKRLQAEGPYLFDTASLIVSAASVAYCPDADFIGPS